MQTWLRIGDYAKARASAAEFRDIFGKENYFLELMDHGLDIEKRVRDGLLQLAKDLELPIIATNDSHYTHADDADAHEVLLCVQSGKTMADPKRSSSTAAATTSRARPRCARSGPTSTTCARPATTHC